MAVHDIKALLKATAYAKDLNIVIEMMSADLNKYNTMQKYKPVKRLIDVMKEELNITKAHLDGCNKIINSKGQIK